MTMMTFILTGSVDEGTQYAEDAGLARRDYVVISPDMARSLEGRRLSDGDLIAEFESFRTHPRAHEVTDVLEREIFRGRSQARWEKIGA